MLFQFGFYSSLLLITFSQGLLYSALLLRKAISYDIKSNYWLSFFLLLCCLYITPWMLGFAGWYDSQPYRDVLFYVPFQHLYLFGPVIYFYTQSLLNSDFSITKKGLIHFLPAALYLLYSLFMWLYDSFVFESYFFYEDGQDRDFDAWYQYTGLASMSLYLIASLKYYNVYKTLVYQFTSFAEAILFRWIRTYLLAFLILILLPIVFDLLGLLLPEIRTYKGNWWFFLFFSLIMYYLAITAYANPVISKIGFRLISSNPKPMLLIKNDEKEQEEIIDLADDDPNTEIDEPLKIWISKIENIIQSEELFRNPELTLSDLAKKLETNTSILSKAINHGFKMNFNDFINSYRVKSVKISFSQGQHQTSTLLGIAFDCGFNSKATFNRAFKKAEGITPKEYITEKSGIKS